MKNQYTVSDLYALKEILDNLGVEVEEGFDFYVEVLDKLKNQVRESEISQEFIEEMLLNWIEGINAPYPKVSAFIFTIKLRNVPLFLNDNDLKLFVEWRLKIAK